MDTRHHALTIWQLITCSNVTQHKKDASSIAFCGQRICTRGEDNWYVQNVSTFPNTFAVVWSLTCMIWMQLTQTNAVFSRIALVSSFCAEKSTFKKNSDFNCDRHISPEDPRSQNGSRRGCMRQPRHSRARTGMGPRPRMAWPPRSPPDAPLWTT